MVDEEAVRIDVTMDELDAEKGLKKLERTSKKTFRSFEKDAKKGTKAAGRFSKSLGGIKSKILALGSAAAITALGRKAVQNFLEQEKAVIRLDAALKLQGNSLGFVRTEMAEYAAELQKVTIYGDEAFISGMALATSFGATTEQAKELVLQAANLSDAFGQDLNASIQQMARTLGGQMGELGEKLPALRALSQQQLMSGGVIGVVRNQFGGTSLALAETKGGRLAQILNDLGDDLEPIGGMILTGFVSIVDSIGKASNYFEERTKMLPDWVKFGLSPMKYAYDAYKKSDEPTPSKLSEAGKKAALEIEADRDRRRKEEMDRLKLEAIYQQFARDAGLSVGPSMGLNRLQDLQTGMGGSSPDMIAQLMAMSQTPGQRHQARVGDIGAQFGLLADLRGAAAGEDGQMVTPGDSQARKQAIKDSLTQAFAESSPIIYTFAEDLSFSVQSSLADGLNAGFRSGSVKEGLEAFSQSLMNSVINSLSEALAAGLTTELGLDDIAGLLAGVGGAAGGSAKPAASGNVGIGGSGIGVG